MIIGSLNIRGGGSSAKRRRIHQLIVKGNADIFLIQESKLVAVSNSIAFSFWRRRDIGFSFMLFVGAFGGLISLWNSESVQVLCSFGGEDYLGLKVVWMEEVFYIVNVYSSCNSGEKRVLWRKLLDLKSRFSDGEWVIAGDFNAAKNMNERKGSLGRYKVSEARDFLEFINLSNLVDVPSKGKKFTWFGGDGKARSRIDRFLVADNIVNKWGVVCQMVGDRDVSDHFPIWLISNKVNWGPKPFKVNGEWFSNKDFLPFVEKVWKELVVEGRGDSVLKEKLKILKESLKWWNLNVFGKYDLAVEEGVRVMNEGDEMVDDVDRGEDSLGEDEVRRKRRACSDFWFHLKIKENMLIQKSRLKWLNDGDCNSRYFHNIMKSRRIRNHIGSIVTERGVVDSVEEVK
ncbi:uncharacterized protein LOC131649887 [Vicia villosa]|uniref:uncharacterized protein LOC131649887 n=1 Tax=Vicia villosa TaxID=3911 RepID=UPI00273CC939|nr:uncharacterized protein LOC131649887 [Vicia villosa]